MEDTFIVIMLKNSQTGFLETELGSYKVAENENLIHNIYVLENNSKKEVYMRLSVCRELLDWEFSAVFDYYDIDVFKDIAIKVIEDDEGYNPIWEVVFEFTENDDEMERIIENILKIHRTELDEVYEEIKSKESDYSNEDRV
ncbi:MAG: hypothetical protein FWD82_07615 [Defluviitaleaceae bacterium]|nr:hypothetical protein [Defluviitaleaceae bacterium]